MITLNAREIAENAPISTKDESTKIQGKTPRKLATTTQV